MKQLRSALVGLVVAGCGAAPAEPEQPAPSSPPPTVRIGEQAEPASDASALNDGSDAWTPGGEVVVQFVVRPTTQNDVACAMRSTVHGLRCVFVTPGERATDLDDVNPNNILHPFESVAGERLLVAGVWQTFSVAQRLSFEADGFVATCTLEPLGRAADARMRLFRTAPWADASGNKVARAKSCTVEPPPRGRVARGGVARAPLGPPPMPPPPPQPRVCLKLEKHSPRLGPPHAKVTILEFVDHQ